MNPDFFNIPGGVEGPAWMLSFSIFLGIISKYILQPFFKFFYNDFLKDYWQKRLEIINNQRAGVMGYGGVIDMVEGKYHLLARQLISYAIMTSERYAKEEIEDNDIMRQLRTNMHDSMQRAKNDLSKYTSALNAARLNKHLVELTEREIIEFYAPIIIAIHETKQGESAKLRDVILSQIDNLTTAALTILTSRNTKKKNKNAA